MIIGIDTATPVSSVALGNSRGIVSSLIIEGSSMHAEHLVPAIKSLCGSSDVSLRDISAIGVDVGPGLFTGLRVGIAAAKSLAMALGISVVGVVSIDALAYPMLEAEPCRMVGAIDARRGEVFAASISPGERADPRVMTPEELIELVEREVATSAAGGPVRLVGDGFRRHFASCPEGAVRAGEDFPSAGSVVILAATAVSRGEESDPDQVVPIYLRAPDARINWEMRANHLHPEAGGPTIPV